MILIKHIEFIETDRDPYEIFHTKMPYETVRVTTNGGTEPCAVEVIAELVRGAKFGRPDGKIINVGMSKQAQEVIGIQYEVWQEQAQQISAAENSLFKCATDLRKAQNKLKKYETAGFLDRLAYCVHGFMS